MQVTIEEINGNKCTVIRKPFDQKWVKEQLDMGIPVLADGTEIYGDNSLCLYAMAESHNRNGDRIVYNFYAATEELKRNADTFVSTVTILPALPRYPRPEDRLLLYRYMAEGVRLIIIRYHGTDDKHVSYHNGEEIVHSFFKYEHLCKHEIVHALDFDGNKLKIAVKELKYDGL